MNDKQKTAIDQIKNVIDGDIFPSLVLVLQGECDLSRKGSVGVASPEGHEVHPLSEGLLLFFACVFGRDVFVDNPYLAHEVIGNHRFSKARDGPRMDVVVGRARSLHCALKVVHLAVRTLRLEDARKLRSVERGNGEDEVDAWKKGVGIDRLCDDLGGRCNSGREACAAHFLFDPGEPVVAGDVGEGGRRRSIGKE